MSMPAFKESSATPYFTRYYTSIIGGIWCGSSHMPSATNMQAMWSRTIGFSTHRAIRRSGIFDCPMYLRGITPGMQLDGESRLDLPEPTL